MRAIEAENVPSPCDEGRLVWLWHACCLCRLSAPLFAILLRAGILCNPLCRRQQRSGEMSITHPFLLRNAPSPRPFRLVAIVSNHSSRTPPAQSRRATQVQRTISCVSQRFAPCLTATSPSVSSITCTTSQSRDKPKRGADVQCNDLLSCPIFIHSLSISHNTNVEINLRTSCRKWLLLGCSHLWLLGANTNTNTNASFQASYILLWSPIDVS